MAEIIADHNFHHRQLLRRHCCGASAEPGQCSADYETCNCRVFRRCHRYPSSNRLLSIKPGSAKYFLECLLEVPCYTPRVRKLTAQFNSNAE
jgi:hypothetical protein